MPDFQFDQKPPLDYKYHEKPKHDEYYTPERGGCLTAFLLIMGIGNIAFGLMVCAVLIKQNSFFNSSLSQLFSYMQLGISIAAFTCAYGLWDWKRWAYNGIYGIYLFNVVIALLVGQISGAIGTIIGMLILYYLMKDKAGYLS